MVNLILSHNSGNANNVFNVNLDGNVNYQKSLITGIIIMLITTMALPQISSFSGTGDGKMF